MAQTQFRSDDTTLWWLKYGDGSDGAYSSAGNATDAPVDSACTGTVDTTSLTATNASFTNGEPILIHQSRGTGAGAWELNQIASYTTGTITTQSALKNTYSSGAQVIQLKQYSSFTQNSGHTLTAKAWNGTVGGIIAFLCNGTTTITGTLSLSGKGYSVSGLGAVNNGGTQGEGTNGVGTSSASANGNGGGAGIDFDNQGGAGGGNGASGTTNGSATAGASAGSASLVTAVFGGEGGGANVDGNGGAGGGLLLMITKTLAEITGSIALTGGNGTGPGSGNTGGGGGAGGSCLIKAQTATLGTNKITSSGGTGGNQAGSPTSRRGGNGAVGRIHLDYLTSYTGTTTPTIDVTQDSSLTSGGAGALFFAQY